MPAEGGHARNLAQRQANARRQGRSATPAGGGNWSNRHRNTSGVRQNNGLTVSSVSHLQARAHRPGQDPGSYDPRWAATSQQWGAGTRSQRGNRAQAGFQEGGRWWERDTGVRMSTDITQTDQSQGRDFTDLDIGDWRTNQVGSDWAERQRQRWGDDYGSIFTMQGMNPFDEGNLF